MIATHFLLNRFRNNVADIVGALTYPEFLSIFFVLTVVLSSDRWVCHKFRGICDVVLKEIGVDTQVEACGCANSPHFGCPFSLV